MVWPAFSDHHIDHHFLLLDESFLYMEGGSSIGEAFDACDLWTCDRISAKSADGILQ